MKPLFGQLGEKRVTTVGHLVVLRRRRHSRLQGHTVRKGVIEMVAEVFERAGRTGAVPSGSLKVGTTTHR